MAKKTTHVMRGTLDWAKVTGKARLNTFSEENEWSVDFTPDDKGLAEINKVGIGGKLKTPKPTDKRKKQYLAFRQKEFRTDAKTGEKTANRPITVVDATGQSWPEPKLIGNGTEADVKFDVVPYGLGKPIGVYIGAIRILKHVPYQSQDFAPLSEDDEFFAETSADADFGDDTPPFEVDEKPAATQVDLDSPDLDDDIVV